MSFIANLISPSKAATSTFFSGLTNTKSEEVTTEDTTATTTTDSTEEDDAAAKAEGEKQRKAAALAQGAAGTILTSGMGLQDSPTISRKELFGE